MTRRNLQPLESLLSEISQRCWAVRWYPDVPWYGWYFSLTGPQGAGRAQILQVDVDELQELRQELQDGWILYPFGRPAYVDKHRWLMAYGGGPPKVQEEQRRLERKIQPYLDIEDEERVDMLLQGTMRWW